MAADWSAITAPVLGVIATSFFFGLIHIDPCQGYDGDAHGLVAALRLPDVAVAAGLPMLLHFVNNSLAVLVTRVPQLKDSRPTERIPVFVYVSALLLLGVAFALYQSRARLEPKMPDQLFAWRPAFEGVEYPPAESGMQVVHPSPSPAAVALAGGGFLFFLLACVAWAYQS